MQRWKGSSELFVTIDFLIPTDNESRAGGSLLNIEPDFGAIVTPRLELAFMDRHLIPISGTLPSRARGTRDVPVCGPGAFTVLKSLAFGDRTANKDTYDLFYVWNAVSIVQVATSLQRLQPNTQVSKTLDIIQRDFMDLDGLGPVGAALFIASELDDVIQADVSGLARELLRVMGRSI